MLAAVLVTSASASANTHPSTRDGQSVSFHTHRARVLFKSAYVPSKSHPDRQAIEAAQAHRRAVLIRHVRRQLGEFRDKVKARWEQARFQATYEPYAGPNGTTWALPYTIVFCESSGINANPSGFYGILMSTWTDSHWGGTAYGPTPYAGGKEAQSIVATRILHEVGFSAWECQA